MPDQTFKRNLAKFAVGSVVYTGTTLVTDKALNEVTDNENEITDPRIVSQMTGVCAMLLLKPYTDGLVDRVADWRIARKIRKAEKTLDTE